MKDSINNLWDGPEKKWFIKKWWNNKRIQESNKKILHTSLDPINN